MINSVYDYYISTYANKSISRHDSHKRSELRELYNNIIKLNKAAPLYKVDMSESSQKLAIDIKEAARSLSATLGDITDISEGETPIGIVATSDNPALVTAEYIGSGLPENESLEFSVKQLATPQINTGEYLPIGAKSLFPGNYSFDIESGSTIYELQFSVTDSDNNGTVLDKLARSITRSDIGLKAEVVQNDYGLKALQITSDAVGSRKGSPYLFRITENSGSSLSGSVNALGLDNVSQYPSNAVFDINGMTNITESNSFCIDGLYEVTLHGTSAEEGTGNITAIKDGSALTIQYEALCNNYNKLLDLSHSRNTHELRMLGSGINSTVKRYRTLLEGNGIILNEDCRLSPDMEFLSKAAQNGTVFDNLKNLQPFKDSLKKNVSYIEVNPMEYINKKIVAYKNPNRLISTPYASSIYTGMMFDTKL